jgi:CBS domain-containing protein
MKLREVMTAGVPAVLEGDTVDRCARLMLEHNLPALPVADAAGRLAGVVYASDLVAKHAHVHAPFYFGLLGAAVPFLSRREDEEIRHALAVTVGDLMERDVATVSSDAEVEEAATIMVDDSVAAVPVVDGGNVVGLLTEADLLRLLLVEDADGDGVAR